MNSPSKRRALALVASGVVGAVSMLSLGTASAATPSPSPSPSPVAAATRATVTAATSTATATAAATTTAITIPPTTIPPTTASVVTGAGLLADVSLLSGGVFQQLVGPLFPGVQTLQPTPLAVTIAWFDRSDNEQKFVLYKRDLQGAWQVIYEVPTRNVAGGGNYSYVDTDRSVSGQCYRIAAVNGNGAQYTKEQCTVRPDPSKFPQTTPTNAQQWFGLSSVNDGTGNLQNGARSSYTSLKHGDQTFGVNLVWSESPALWRIQAQGGPQLMRGQAVALRVWGGGWLKYGHETWGINLVLSDTPSYEWYLLAGKPGLPIDNGSFGLWNSVANDYLVSGHRTWGVDLKWYQDTLPTPPPPPTPTQGVKTIVDYNCISEQRPLEMWVADLSAGTGYVDKGRLDPQWANGACPYTGQPWIFTPTSGHQFLVRAVDYQASGCSNDPTLASCWRSQMTFIGDANGVVVPNTIG